MNYNPIAVWNLGGSLLAPLLQGGRLTAQLDIANAERDQAAFAYRKAVLVAFSEAENALSAQINLARQHDRTEFRRTILERSLTLARDRYRAGYSSYLDGVDAQRNFYSAELGIISVREQQLNAMISLWEGLSGGGSERF